MNAPEPTWRRELMKLAAVPSLLVALAVTTLSPSAWADSAADKAAAEALFDQGVKLLGKGEYAAACKKLEASQRVDPGIGTLLYLADCYEKVGRTASAWATFREAASLAQSAGQEERTRIGNERAGKLELKLSRLTIDVAAETQALPGVVVKRGEEAVPEALFGAAIPVDPGSQFVTATAPGHLPYEARVEVGAEGAMESVSIPALQPDPNAPPPEARQEESAAPAPAGAAVGSDVPPAPPEPGRGMRIAGFVVGGVGVVGLGVGSAFGLMAIDKNNQALDPAIGGCVDAQCATARGGELSDAALGDATVSTVAFIAGSALVATGVVLYLVAPSEEKEKPLAHRSRLFASPLPGGAAIGLGGSF